MKTARDLRNDVIDAFSDVPYPGDDNLTSYECEDCWEPVLPVLKGQHWKDWVDRPLEFLRKGDGDQHFVMTPAALHFFYPLYLLATLDDLHKADIYRAAMLSVLISPYHCGRHEGKYGNVEEHIDSYPQTERERDQNRLDRSKSLPPYLAIMRRLSNRQVSVIQDVLQFLKIEHPKAIFVVDDINIALKSIATFPGFLKAKE